MITPITIRGVTLYVLLKIDPTERWFQFQFPVSWYVYDTPPTYYFDRNLKFNVACTRWGAMRQAKRACRRIARHRLAHPSTSTGHGDTIFERYTYEAWIEGGIQSEI